ncbi:TonB-dependent receptor [Dyella mobilis]|uniref:TonB-dependent receptor n=1 Tax=Dyella mobilis TaxID=1849582 RepID=A0ABS2KDF1_9GAMM|nr:TonB-dependent receptor [Dyella mobilis]MBM7128802.1 TonB-dependent receptor [Dyella mobilis]GLQ99134.1 TonB-dependent receptor [Dyella mobilis]
MNKQFTRSPAHNASQPCRLSFAIAMTLFAAGQLHAQATQPAPQSNDQAAPATQQNTKNTNKKKDASSAADEKEAKLLGGLTVNGFSNSLNQAQEIKRYADTVVDAISAQDAGSLPDTSVTEALKRVPGVAVSAFGVAADPDHFSIQGSDISLQGLPYTNTLFNGREVFSAGGGHGLDFFTVSPELIGSVVVSKNQTADMLEGGIAGSIDLNTRKPFDSKKDTQASFTVGDYWGTLDKKGTPQMSGLFSHNWNTDIGRFGVLFNIAYDRIDQQDNAISLVDFQRRCDGCSLPNGRTDDYPGLAPGQYAYVPVGGDIRVQDDTSTRFGHVLSSQWESPDKAWLATLEWDRASDKETTYEHTLQASTDGCAFGQSLAGCAIPVPGSTPTYDSNGVFQSGIIGGAPGSSSFLPLTYGGVQTQLDSTAYRNRYVTNDYSFNLKWNVNDRLHLSGDVQDTNSNYNNFYYYIRQLTQADWAITQHGNGVPSVAVLSPDPNETTAQYFANPNNSYWAAAQDHFANSWGNQRTFRLDGTFDVDADFLDNLQFGVRHSDQHEVVQNSAYNYSAISSPYGQNAVTAGDTPGDTSLYNLNLPGFSGSNFGGVVAPYFNLNPLTQFGQASAIIQQINKQAMAMNPPGSVGQYYTLYQRMQYVNGDVFVPGTYYLPQEVDSNEEKTNAAYVRLNFGNDNTDFLSGVQISGNVGLRFVRTEDDAAGYLTLPNQVAALDGISIAQYCLNQTKGGGTAAPGTFCGLTPAQQQQYVNFANGAYTPINASNSYGTWLPSFNLALGWTSDLITRFAFSKSVYRPTLSQLQAGQTVSGLLPYGTNGSSVPTVGNGYTGTNPYLLPISAHNFDITQEWYFGHAGSMSATLFYKQLNNTIQQLTDVVDTTVTNNGVTYPEQYSAGLVNLKGGSVRGAELAYQQKYDFLPYWLSGFGTQMNYTYIQPRHLSYGTVDFCPSGYAPPTQCVNQLKLPPYELSRDTYNFTVYYEKGPLSTRLAYNWRSSYLITANEADYPFLPVMASSQGQLDASIIYALTPHVKLSLQAANILNSTFKTREIVNTGGLSVPKGFFRDDTRFNLSIRADF